MAANYMATKSEFIPGTSDIGAFSQEVLQATRNAIKASGSLPSNGEEYEHYSTFTLFGEVMRNSGRRILNLMSKIMKHQDMTGNLNRFDLEEKFDLLTEANDVIMEKIGTSLDKSTGKKTKESVVTLASINARDVVRTSWNRQKNEDNASSSPNYRLLTAKNILRPQLKFKDKIDNSSKPFVPIIKEKPNSIRPLAIILEPTKNGVMFSHPYHCELDHFTPSADLLKPVEVQSSKPIADTPLVHLRSPDQLKEFVEHLKKQDAIAIDLEHHNYRSFQGITCLMQLSTRDTDYIVDTLELRSDLQILNEIFTDPRIVKVLHGADMDIQWLQRDLGLYIVNMFDTGQAARVLNMASYSLAYLLKHYCKVEADKQYQLADWRIRPLPDEMVHYAREDTHYLLYIYDMMRNELFAKGNEEANLLMSVYQRSKIVCTKRYEKPIFNDDTHLDVYRKSKKVFNTRQMHALKELSKWRDKAARVVDESFSYVLPNHMLLKIAELLPREQQGVIACCNPIPPLVRSLLNELHHIVLMAREVPLVKVLPQEATVDVPTTQRQVDLDNPLLCPHDFPETGESAKSSSQLTATIRGVVKEVGPKITVLDNTQCCDKEFNIEKVQCIQEILLESVSPYQRYLKTKSLKAEELPVEDKVKVKVEVVEKKVEEEPKVLEEKVVKKEEVIDDGPIRKSPAQRDQRGNQLKRKAKDDEDEEALPERREKERRTERFQPFDYGKEKLQEFRGPKKKGGRGRGKGRGRHSGIGSMHQPGSRWKKTKAGHRSMTYSSGGK